MTTGLERAVVDRDGHARNVAHLRALGVELPRIADLADPPSRLAARAEEIAGVDPDSADVRNLFRVHWHNGADRRSLVDVPEHIVLPEALTGVAATIIVALGNRFPLIAAHKVLAAYGCLIPRLLSGAFDVTRHRAVWPSTGNYCRGGVAIAKLLGCRSVAVLPEGMSRERFDWLEDWVVDPGDVHRTPGTESNVKEIYDACHVLARDERNLILNQFSEYGNYVVHRAVTGPALERIFAAYNEDGSKTARAFVCASGSAGTLAAGDWLKRSLGTRTCVVEALECPTLLYNGYGEHNIQGIGDKHVPLIHNVMGTDFVIGVSDRGSDALNMVFNTVAGRAYLSRHRQVGQQTLAALDDLGLSSIANILGAIKYAKYMALGADDVILTVATDGAGMYRSEIEPEIESEIESEIELAGPATVGAPVPAVAQGASGRFANAGRPLSSFPPRRESTRAEAAGELPCKAAHRSGGLSEIGAAEAFGQHLLGAGIDHVSELTRFGRERIFNLGYYTWVEQQGTSLADFDRRRDPAFWDGLMELVTVWDGMIDGLNAAIG